MWDPSTAVTTRPVGPTAVIIETESGVTVGPSPDWDMGATSS
jgi:hypothetical protein